MSENIKKKISRSLNLPQDTIMDIPSIRIIGNNQIAIENHKGIIEYTNSLLRLKSKSGIIKITGSELKIMEISEEEISVNGIINSVGFMDV